VLAKVYHKKEAEGTPGYEKLEICGKRTPCRGKRQKFVQKITKAIFTAVGTSVIILPHENSGGESPDFVFGKMLPQAANYRR
jgi:hypothetical protein